MREKEKKGIITFSSTAAALAAERQAKQLGLPGRLIPTPVSVTASCGLAWMVEWDQLDSVCQALKEKQLTYHEARTVWI